MDLVASQFLPLGWVEACLSDFCHIIQGQSPPGDTYNTSGEGVPFFQGKSEFGPLYATPRKWCSAPTKMAALDDILISIRAPVGPTNLCPEAACIGRGLAAIRPEGDIPIRYVLYGIHATVKSLAEKATGTTFEAISGDDLRTHRLTLAPLLEQSRIVAEIERQFSLLDAGVANLKRVQATLKRYRASVLQAACTGQLVPTEAELAQAEGRAYEPADVLLTRILAERRARWEAEQWAKKHKHPFVHTEGVRDPKQLPLNPSVPSSGTGSSLGEHLTFNEVVSAFEEEAAGSVVELLFRKQQGSGSSPVPPELGARGLLAKGYKEPAAPDTSGLPELPKGWVWADVAQLGDVKGGKRLPLGHNYSDGDTGLVYIRVCDFYNGTVSTKDLRYLLPATQERIKRYTISAKDVYISIAGSIGLVGTVPATLDGANLTENAAKITDLRGTTAKYLSLSLSTPQGQQQIVARTVATTQAKLALFRIEQVAVPLPPLAEQERIVAEVERRLSVVDNLEQVVKANLKRAERLRQAILKEAFAGRLVAQDPADEPATVLLERIKAEREAQAVAAKPSRRKERPDAKPGHNDAAGTAVPSGHARRDRGTADQARLQPDLFSPNGL